jgi:hypothetical protein
MINYPVNSRHAAHRLAFWNRLLDLIEKLKKNISHGLLGPI